MSDEPPILSVGTAVSAKYKGAFCEAKVSRVFPQLRYRVSFKESNLGTDTLKEEQIKATGTVRVGKTVLAWHHGQKTFLEAQVTRIQDQSQYTVVFDDGDITTLRRNYLCLKSGRHFNESETLDQLPLTHPEHFSNPVVGGRSRRRNRNRGDDSDGEHEEADPVMEGYASEIGRVVMGENTEKKRNQDWPPGLILMPKNPKMLNTKEEYFIRSFKDDRFYNVPRKDVMEFNKEIGEKVEKSNTPFYIGIQKALKYINTGELPANWEKHFFQTDRAETDPELNFSDSSDDEPCEEKDRFVAQLYKFLDDAGTPLNKTPTISGEDVDLYRLFSAVTKLGGYNKVSNHNKWKSVTGRLRLGSTLSITNQVKQVYKKCLLSFEGFYKTLGVTMLNHTKPSKKNKGRSLIRDKDRATPINSPKPDKDDEIQDKKEEEKAIPEEKDKLKRRSESNDKKKNLTETNESSSDATDHTEPSTSKDTGRPKRTMEVKSWAKEKKYSKPPTGEKVKTLVEKFEEQNKKDEGQQTRSKSQLPKASPGAERKSENKILNLKEIKDSKDIKDMKGQVTKAVKKIEDDKDKTKRARKRSHMEAEGFVDNPAAANISVGDKLKVYYGPSIESKITYEAKVVEIDKDGDIPLYLVHYTGWNTRYDEWIGSARVAENLSATTKAKRLKQGIVQSPATASTSKSVTPSTSVNKIVPKGKRGVSVTRRTSVNELSRSTTPLSSTSNSSRPKTPATPATRSSTRNIRQEQKRARRTSVQTDTSVHTDTESAASESEPELTRTRSGGKNDEPEVRTYKKRVPRPLLNKARAKVREDDDDTEKEEEQATNERPKRTRKVKRTPEKSADDSDDDTITLPKGRDFDLNQIRSELKGFSKAIPVALDNADKDTTSSDDSGKPLMKSHVTAEEDDDDFEEEKKPIKEEEKEVVIIAKPTEESSSCEDIYEFKEPEPFEFESRSTLTEDKVKKRLPRFYEDAEKSPSKSLVTKSPGRCELVTEYDKKILKSPIKIKESEDDEDDVLMDSRKKRDDPFDKLVESPSFNMGKSTEVPIELPSKPTVIEEEPLGLFREPPEISDDFSGDMELSDTESQTQPIFTTRNEDAFSDAFTKSSSEQNTLDLEFPKSEDRNDDEEIQASIQRVIEQTSSTDDDTRDVLLQVTLPITSYQVKKHEVTKPSNLFDLSTSKEAKPSVIESENSEKSVFSILKQMSPIPQHIEKKSPTLLESINRQSLIQSTNPLKMEENEDKNEEVKPLVSSILDAFKNETEIIADKEELKEEVVELKEEEVDICKEDSNIEKPIEVKAEPLTMIALSGDELRIDVTEIDDEVKNPISNVHPNDNPIESKKRRKVVSRPYIETDSDSSDSDNLVIGSEDESQTNSIGDEKEMKDNWDSNMSVTRIQLTLTDDSQTAQTEERNFKFDKIPEKEEKVDIDNYDTKSVSDNMEIEPENKEEPDSQLHSMLLCEETIPRSPAPSTEATIEEPVRRSKSALEMPFASVPGSSNNKSMLLGSDPVKLIQPLVVTETQKNREPSAGTINTPPSTPESTLSNLSPRDNNERLSPDSRDIDNTISCVNEYQQKRSNANKISCYSEDDSQMACDPPKKIRDDSTSATLGRKRRRSYRTSEASTVKRGRKPVNRSRHNSDSEEDTSDHSLISSNAQSTVPYNRSSRTERPLKYDFRANLDGITDSNQRINIILQKIADLKKVYVDVKAELADVERKKKKIKRRKREALKSVKQVVTCVS